MANHRTLIIKTGYVETLADEEASRTVSKGDVFRATVLLHLYKNDEVTWLTDKEAFPLLEGNPYINRLMAYDFTTRDQLLAENFDTVINLEKYPPLCALTRQIDAWRKYGFRLDPKTGEAKAFDRAFEVLTVSADPIQKKANKRNFQELLFGMVGEKWRGEEYILGYKPKTLKKYDVALNTLVGEKWPTKAWPKDNWVKLEKLLINDGFTVNVQEKQSPEMLKNLYSYMDWINSCKVLVSNDSLGLHIGLTLKKRVIGLFGATPDREIYFYGRGEAINPKPSPNCRPCFNGRCMRGKNCIGSITPRRVYNKIKRWTA